MKRLILYSLSSILGVCLGVLFHCSFMLVEADGCLMLPTIEPGQNVIVCLLDKNIEEGDLVAYKTPYYTLDGEGNIVFRRVTRVQQEKFLLTCDAQMTEEQSIELSKDELLGKAVLLDIYRR